MAITAMTGFETSDTTLEAQSAAAPIAFTGTAGFSTVQKRTGSTSIRCNPASGANGFAQLDIGSGPYFHFGLYIAALPTVTRRILGINSSNHRFELKSDGTIDVFNGASTLVGTTQALATNTWYWIGYRTGSFTGVFFQLNGVDELSGTVAWSGLSNWGPSDSAASAMDIYFDDFIGSDSGFLQPSNVGLLLPTSDNAIGTGWVGGAGGTTNLFAAVDNTPPVGVADTGTNSSQIRNATSAANSNYDVNLTTYSAAGIVAGSTILAVRPMIVTAAPVTTSAKQGTVGVASNPTITNVALGAGGTAGAFWSGAAGATYPTGWKYSLGTMTQLPSVTLGTAPVMRVTQVTASTRIAMVCFMGMLVVWTPPAPAANPPHINPYPPLLAQ